MGALLSVGVESDEVRHASVAEGVGLDLVDVAAHEANTVPLIVGGIGLPASIR
jgi:hypothetical protein